jgi:hypothetical protein
MKRPRPVLPSGFCAVASGSGARYVGINCQNPKRRFNRRTYELAIRERPFRADRTGPVRGAYAANPPGGREARGRSFGALTGVRRVVLGLSRRDSAALGAPRPKAGRRRNLSKPMIPFCSIALHGAGGCSNE